MPADRRMWFGRGFAIAALACGALNAASYFVRSEKLGDLAGFTPDHAEALGFPLLMWQKGDSYSGFFVDYFALGINTLFASVLGVIGGMAAVRTRGRWERLASELKNQEHPPRRNFQFSMRALLWLTTLAAVIAALAPWFPAGRPEVLLVILLFGPTILVATAYIPRGIPWRQRVGVLLGLIPLLIATAIAAGAYQQPRREFDQVLLAIFICWTPQSALAAAILTAILVQWHEAARFAR